MKFSLIVSIMVLMPGLLYLPVRAQTILCGDYHTPKEGDSFNYIILTDVLPFDPGPTGKSVLWNFSSLSGAETTKEIYLPHSDSHLPAFPQNSNLILLKTSDGSESYEFFNADQNGFIQTGGGWEEDGRLIFYQYDDPLMRRKFPFGFKDEYSDTYEYSIGYDVIGDDLLIQVSGTMYCKADAHGTLITSHARYDSVLRIKSIYTEQIKTYLDGKLINISKASTLEYSWFTDEINTAVMEVKKMPEKESFTLNFLTGN